MSVTINNLARKAWQVFIKEGMTKQGAAAMLGNIFAESGMNASIVEYLCLQRLKENGKNYTQESYRQAVDSGKISRAEFLNPLPNKQYGWGWTQLTTPVPRKSEFYDRTVGIGKSIADEDEQINYTIYELKNRYKTVWKTLTTTTSIKTASDTVLRDFESPNNWQQYSSLRVQYSQEYYDYFSKQSNDMKGSDVVSVNKTQAINAMISVAEAEIGYLEKASNSQLDSKTANAGSNNYTKYWRDVYPTYQAQAWCACFVSWVMMKTFGLETAKKLLKHWPYVYCPTMASLFTLNANPKKGDIVIFYRNGVFAHTGIVIEVNGDLFTTIEGNTSNGSSIISNGGGVYKKQYQNSNLPGTKFCTPDYSLVTKILSGTTTSATSTTTSTTTTSTKVSEIPQFKGKVNKGTAKVRTWAGSENKEVSFSPLKKNTVVEVCDTVKDTQKRNWYFIKVDGKFGFILSDYITKVTTVTATEKKKVQYRVQAGVYSVKNNALAIQKTLKAEGFDSIIVTVDGQNIVQCGLFDQQSNALILNQQLIDAGFQSVVIAIKS